LRVFLYVVANEAPIRERALLAGYTPSTHEMGLYLASHLAGQRSFGEWREWRSLRPSRDPDLPEVLDQLEATVARWRPPALQLVAGMSDELDRVELEAILGEREASTRVRRARLFIGALEHVRERVLPTFGELWDALAAQGIEPDLARARELLEDTRNYLRSEPLTDDELREMDAARESLVRWVQDWLDERRKQLEAHLDLEALVLLGLGDITPPSMPDVPIWLFLRWPEGAN
jgi:hypothetical protein